MAGWHIVTLMCFSDYASSRRRCVIATILAAASVLCSERSLCADDATSKYFEQLRSRRMFSVAEGYCLHQLSKQDLSATRRSQFAVELSKTLSEHAKYTIGDEQAELWERAQDAITEFLKTDPTNSNRSWLEAERALAKGSKGEILRRQAELYPEESRLKQRAELSLNEALSILSQIEASLDGELRALKKQPSDDPDVISMYQKRMLLYEIRFQLGATSLNRARLASVDSGSRMQSLSQAEEWLKPLIAGPDERETTWSSRVLLADAERLRRDYERAESLLISLERKKPVVAVQDRIVAVRVEMLLDRELAVEAAKALGTYRQKRIRLPGELRYLKSRMFIALWKIALSNRKPDLADQLLTTLRGHVERAEREVGGYWGYRCRVLLQQTEESSTYGPELARLVRSAEALFQDGKNPEAVKAYAAAIALAEKSGKETFAAELSFTRASVLLKDQSYGAAKESFQTFVERYSQDSRNAKAHLLWAYCLGKVYEQKQTEQNLNLYQERLQKHLEQFSRDETAGEATWMLANLLERRSQRTEAVQLYLQLAADLSHQAESQVALARCYEAILEQTRKQNKLTIRTETEALRHLGRIVTAFPVSPNSWTVHQAEVGMRLARIYLKRGTPDFGSSDRLLERVFAAWQQQQQRLKPSGKAEQSAWKSIIGQATQLRIVSLAGRNKIDEARRYLQSLSGTGPAEMLTVLDGLTKVAADVDPRTQQRLGELQLQAAGFLNQNREQLSPADQFRLDHSRAQAYVATNQPKKAIEVYDALIQQAPNDKALLIVVAELLSRSESRDQIQKSKGYWRKLESRAKAGSREWLNARYHVIQSSFQLQEYKNCLKLLRVTRILYPGLGGEELRAKFAKLQQQVEEKQTR